MNPLPPDRNERRKPRLVSTLALIAGLAAVLGCVAAFVLFKVQYDILQLADRTAKTLLPAMQTQMRTAINLERLKVFGEVVRSSPESHERSEALLAMRILAINPLREKNVFAEDQVNRVYRIIERMAAYRTEQDRARQQIEDGLAQFHAQIDDMPQSPPSSRRVGKPDALHKLMPQLYPLLHSTLINAWSVAARQAFNTLEQALTHPSTPSAVADDPELERVRNLLQWQRAIFNTEDQLNQAWLEARAIIDHLSESISIDAAVAAADGSAEIAHYAKAAMFMVAAALGGLILLFTAGVYFMRWAVVKPIIRVTRNLEQVEASHCPVQLRREWLRELDNIALAVQAFGAALEQEIAERQKAQAQLLELATTDSLTGLHNRRHFMESAQQELDRARRYQTPLSLALLDADHFKAVNDRYGHPVGDQALQMLAATGRRLLRDIDLFARIGGEEFAILLPQTDHAAAWIVADRLRQAIMDQSIATEAGPLCLTVSLGLASLDPATANLDDLIRRADLALYQAKQNGRNRVESAPNSLD